MYHSNWTELLWIRRIILISNHEANQVSYRITIFVQLGREIIHEELIGNTSSTVRKNTISN